MPTARSVELRALAQGVADALPPAAIEVVLTGSVSRGVADEVSDIELLVVTEEPLSLEEAFELARLAGLEERDSWGDPSTPTRRVFGYLDGRPVETIWWSRELAEELFSTGGSAEALANGVALRTSGLLADWQERLGAYPDELAAERIEKAAERWGGFAPAGLLTIAREDTALARMEWLVESAQRVLAIVFALNRVHEPTAKRLAARVEPLAVKPERLAERIEEALAEPDPRTALRLVTELQLETVRLAPDGPNVDRARTWLARALELLLAAVAILALAACGSGRRMVWSRHSSVPAAASRLSHDCARRDESSSDVDSLLWLRGGRHPLVYYRADILPGHHVLSSPGRRYPLWGVFWPCDPPVIVYGRPFSPFTFVTVLAPGHAPLKTARLGRFRLAGGPNRTSLAGYGNAIVGVDGRLIFFDGTTIRYAGGAEVAAPGLPRGWRITRLAVSPRDSGAFLASVEEKPGPQGCRNTVHGAIYLISATRSTRVRSYDPCTNPVGAEWSPDGRRILWFSGGDTQSIFVSDGQGRHLRELADGTDGALWSPDGRMIAYAQGKRVFVLALSTGARRFIGRGEIGAWSPDGREIALVENRPIGFHSTYQGGSIVAFPVHGNQSRLLLRIPAAK